MVRTVRGVFRAPLDRAEEGAVEGQRGLEHDGHALAGADALGLQQIGEARRPGGQLAERVLDQPSVGVGEAQRHAVAGVTVHTLVGEVQLRAVTVDQRPQRVP